MQLELAESPVTRAASTEANPYIFIPNLKGQGTHRGIYVREDYFDELTDSEYDDFMKFLAPYQPKQGMSSRASRQKRRELRNDRKQAKNDLIRARATAKANGTGFDWNSVVDSVGNIASGIFGGKGGADSAGGQQTTPGGTLPDQAAPQQSFFSQYKWPIVIGGGLIVGYIVYKGTRRKRGRKAA